MKQTQNVRGLTLAASLAVALSAPLLARGDDGGLKMVQQQLTDLQSSVAVLSAAQFSKVMQFTLRGRVISCTSDHDFLIYVNTFTPDQTFTSPQADAQALTVQNVSGHVTLTSFTLGGAAGHTAGVQFFNVGTPEPNFAMITLQTVQGAIADCQVVL
jgi:hypothetical protein